MKEFKPAASFLSFGLLSYFLIPYLIFLTYFKFSLEFNISELAWAVKNSFLQSGLTATFCVVLSMLMSQGLFAVNDRLQKIFLRLLIVPQILPALYSVLIAFSVLNPFPMGTSGIVILFIFINLGFSTLLTFTCTREKLGALAVISEVYSLSRWRFFLKIYLPLLKTDLLANFFIVFIFCLSSFSIPLIAGGGKGTNLEVLIYEKIFVDQNWSAAFGLSLIQVTLIFGLSFFMLRNKRASEPAEFAGSSYLKSYWGLALIGFYLIIYFGGYLLGLIKSLAYFDFIKQYAGELLTVTLFTSGALALYLLLNLALLILWLYDYLENLKFNLASNLISVSTVLIGFVFYLSFPVTKEYDLIKIVFAMSILFFPSLFKLFLQKPIENLQQQILISKMYGLSKLTIIIEIIARQLAPKLFLWLSFLTIWFISEFALLKVLGVQRQTLGLLSESFLSSYRLPLSYLMSLYILVYWVGTMLVIYFGLKVVYVTYKKFVL